MYYLSIPRGLVVGKGEAVELDVAEAGSGFDWAAALSLRALQTYQHW